MRIVLLGDVGVVDGVMHIGDEAMFEAALDELRPRDVTSVTAVSAAPAETATRYGVEAIARVGVVHTRAEVARRLAAIDAVLQGETIVDPTADGSAISALIDAVEASEGVVISGGGNLASTWPLHIVERVALARIARAVGRPLVISGQTLGPGLVESDRALVAELLGSAALVGLRESPSFELALALGAAPARTALTRDDASYLGLDDPPTERGASPTPPGVLVSLAAHLGGLERASAIAGLAAMLDRIADEGSPITFHAHFGTLPPGSPHGDQVLHDEVRASMRAPSRVEPTTTARAAAALARAARLVVTSRYHPAVFATAVGVPAVGLAADDYAEVKLSGALAHDRQAPAIALDAVLDGRALAQLRRALEIEQATRARSQLELPRARAAAAAWWDRVAASLAAPDNSQGRGRTNPLG